MKKVYEIIVNQIIEKLEQGVIPWRKSWWGWVPTNYLNNREYKGINRLILSMNDFSTNYYLTYKQIKKLKWSIKPWSKATKIIYWDIIETETDSELSVCDESETSKKIITKYYNVFNIEQTDIIPKEDLVMQVEKDNDYSLSQSVIKNYIDKPKIVEWYNPCYKAKSDTIEIPSMWLFSSWDEYYAALFHELVHSTGSEGRLKRESIISENYFWSYTYSREELVAEIWSMFLCNYVWVENIVIDNQVSYIDNWLEFIKWNKLDIIKASNQAEKAVSYIMGK